MKAGQQSGRRISDRIDCLHPTETAAAAVVVVDAAAAERTFDYGAAAAARPLRMLEAAISTAVAVARVDPS